MSTDGSLHTSFGRGMSVCLALAVLAGGAASLHADCASRWSDQFALPGVDAHIADTVVWDDGSGPALYAVGSFNRIGGVDQVNIQGVPNGVFNVAKWDGRQWHVVGGAAVPSTHPLRVMTRVNCIQVFDPDGAGPLGEVLVVGGTANPLAAEPHVLLQFDGTAWSTMGSPIGGFGLGDEVRDLEMYNGELYVCGFFSSWGYPGIAKWDATLPDWNDVGGGFQEMFSATNVRAERMAVHDGSLYVAGTFNNVGYDTLDAKHLAKWDGSTWSNVPGFISTSTPVSDIEGAPTLLKAIDLGDGPSLLVGDAVYTGTGARGAALAQLKSGVWSTLIPQTAAPAPSEADRKSIPLAAAMFAGPEGQQLHVGGRWILRGVAGQPPEAGFARRTSAGTFETIDTLSRVDWMFPIDWDFAGAGQAKLLVGINQARGQSFDNLNFGGLHAANIALWNGASAETAHSGSGDLGLGGSFNGSGGGTDNHAWTIKELDPDGAGPLGQKLYIGHASYQVQGAFGAAPSVYASGLVSFDGTSYQQMPGGIARVNAMTTFTPASGGTALYVSGVQQWQNFGDYSNPVIAKLNGNAWEIIASTPATATPDGADASIDAVETATIGGQPNLVVAGQFRRIGDVDTTWVGRYDGTQWAAMDAGLPTVAPGLSIGTSDQASVAVFGGTPYLALTHSDDNGLHRAIYRWNDSASSWSLVMDQIPAAIGNVFLRLAVVDAGTGPSLYAYGAFQSFGGLPGADYIVRWNGSAFEPVASAGFQAASPTLLSIRAIGAHDFGDGKKLVAVLNTFGATTSGGTPVAGLIWLDGTQWRQVAGGASVSGMAAGLQRTTLHSSTNPTWGGLYIGGNFRAVGGDFSNGTDGFIESRGIARLITECEPSCRADFNQDGTPNIDDIFIYLNAWFAGNPRCDMNGDGVNIDDIFIFLNLWFSGCP